MSTNNAVLVADRNVNLAVERNAAERQLVRHSFFIEAFLKAWPERAMNIDSDTNDLVNQGIQRLIRFDHAAWRPWRLGGSYLRRQIPSSMRSGASTSSLTRTRKPTASAPSTMRWS